MTAEELYREWKMLIPDLPEEEAPKLTEHDKECIEFAELYATEQVQKFKEDKLKEWTDKKIVRQGYKLRKHIELTAEKGWSTPEIWEDGAEWMRDLILKDSKQ